VPAKFLPQFPAAALDFPLPVVTFRLKGPGRIAIDAARKRFSPEFWNRIDRIVVFRPLSEEQIFVIAGIEISRIQDLLIAAGHKILLVATAGAVERLARDGYDPRYGARHVRRAVARHVAIPLSGMIASGQIHDGDVVEISTDTEGQVVFLRRESPE